MSAHEELDETRKLVKVVNLFIGHYRLMVTPGTDDEEVSKAAADRVEEALIECMRKATDELAAPARPDSVRAFLQESFS